MTFRPGIFCQGLSKLTLSYSAYCKTERGDVCYFEVSSDSTSWTKVDSLSGSELWQKYDVELMDVIEPGVTKVWFRFHFISNESTINLGVKIDDIKINHVSSPVGYITKESTPTTWGMGQNYPNPFNPTTTIEYAVPRNSHVEIKIIDLLGREVCTLVTGENTAGNHQVTWNGLDNTGSQVASGVYFYQMTAEGFSETRKLLLLR